MLRLVHAYHATVQRGDGWGACMYPQQIAGTAANVCRKSDRVCFKTRVIAFQNNDPKNSPQAIATLVQR